MRCIMVLITDLTRAAGVSRRTIAEWQKRGLVVAPRVVKAKGGRGRQGKYPDSALAVVKEIVAMQRRGLSLNAMASALRVKQRLFLGQISPQVKGLLRQLDAQLRCEDLTLSQNELLALLKSSLSALQG